MFGFRLSKLGAAVRSGTGSSSPTPLFSHNYTTGTIRVGDTIIAEVTDPGGITGATFTWQWYADDIAISGATSDTYTVQVADIGKQIDGTVSYTNDESEAQSLTSPKTTEVSALFDAFLLESGDNLLLESGDWLLLE